MKNLKAGAYDALTFDCYGTLIDWESGMLAYLQPMLLDHDAHVLDSFALEFFADNEPELQAEGGRYAEILKNIVVRLGARLGFTPTDEELAGFPASVQRWEPFPDTVEALQRLSARFELAIVSNIDNALFEATREKLGVEFKHVVTAEDVGAYKPSYEMFNAALDAMQHPPARVLHVAQSLFHDVAPASALGLDTVWIDRTAGVEGAARRTDAEPNWTFASMADFTDAILG